MSKNDRMRDINIKLMENAFKQYDAKRVSKQIDKAISRVVKEQILPDEKTKLRRRIEDYLRKYAKDHELKAIAKLLGIKED